MVFDFTKNGLDVLVHHREEFLGTIRYYETAALPRRGAALSFEIPSQDFVKGAEALKEFLPLYIFSEFSFCITDPDQDDKELISMYECAGFTHYAKVEDFLIMRIESQL